MRECWVNVYVSRSGRHMLGSPQVALSSALAAAGRVRLAGVAGPAYRLHVRLKPEPGQYVELSKFRRATGLREPLPW